MSSRFGTIDISIRAGSRREREILEAIARHPGYHLQRLHRDGSALRLIGPGVHVVVENLSRLTLADLVPAHYGK